MFKTIKDGKMPTRGSEYSACVDLYINENVTIEAGETAIVGLGVYIDLDSLIENVPKIKDMRKWYKKRFKAGITDVSEEDSIFFLKDEFLKSHYLQLNLIYDLKEKGLMSETEIINLDYKDEIKIIIHNPIIYINKEVYFDKEDDFIEIDYMGVSNKDNVIASNRYKIKKGDKVAQIMLKEHKSYLFGI